MFRFGLNIGVGNGGGAVKMAIRKKHKNAKKKKHIRKTYKGKKVKYIRKSLMNLLEMIFEENFKGSQQTALARYKTLNTRISSLHRKTIEHKMIRRYVRNSHGPTHNMKLKIVHVFRVNRHGEYRKYKPKKKYRHRRVLWHGTAAKNYPSILRTGLVLKPPAAVAKMGSMFGNGLYFADCVTKSFQYCHANPIGVLILAEVALGKQWCLTAGKNVQHLSYGKKSVKALGKYRPYYKKTIKSRSGAKVPLGRLILQKNFQSQLIYNEYIVYNENQVFLNYLVLVKKK